MYTAIAVSDTKGEADKYTERARNEGHLARVVEMSNNIGGHTFTVYAIRKK